MVAVVPIGSYFLFCRNLDSDLEVRASAPGYLAVARVQVRAFLQMCCSLILSLALPSVCWVSLSFPASFLPVPPSQPLAVPACISGTSITVPEGSTVGENPGPCWALWSLIHVTKGSNLPFYSYVPGQTSGWTGLSQSMDREDSDVASKGTVVSISRT